MPKRRKAEPKPKTPKTKRSKQEQEEQEEQEDKKKENQKSKFQEKEKEKEKAEEIDDEKQKVDALDDDPEKLGKDAKLIELVSKRSVPSVSISRGAIMKYPKSMLAVALDGKDDDSKLELDIPGSYLKTAESFYNKREVPSLGSYADCQASADYFALPVEAITAGDIKLIDALAAGSMAVQSRIPRGSQQLGHLHSTLKTWSKRVGWRLNADRLQAKLGPKSIFKIGPELRVNNLMFQFESIMESVPKYEFSLQIYQPDSNEDGKEEAGGEKAKPKKTKTKTKPKTKSKETKEKKAKKTQRTPYPSEDPLEITPGFVPVLVQFPDSSSCYSISARLQIGDTEISSDTLGAIDDSDAELDEGSGSQVREILSLPSKFDDSTIELALKTLIRTLKPKDYEFEKIAR